MGRQTVEHMVGIIEADASAAIAALEAFDAKARNAAKDETKNINIDVDQSAADRVKELNADLTKDETKTIHVNVDRNSLSNMFGALTTDLGKITHLLGGIGQGITNVGQGVSEGFEAMAKSGAGAAKVITEVGQSAASVGGGGGGGGGILGSLMGGLKGVGGAAGAAFAGLMAVGKALLISTLIYAVYSGLTILIGALQMLSAVAVGAVATLAPLVGLLGGIPAMIGVGMGGLLVLFAGLKNVFGAVGAMDKATKDASKSTYDAAAAARALAAAQREVKLSIEAVAKAREEAAKNIVNKRRDLQSAIWSEADAVDAVARAQENLAKIQRGVADNAAVLSRETDYFTGKVYEVARVNADAADKGQTQAEAIRAVLRAQQELMRSQERTKQAREDLTDAEKKGINGNEGVISANNRLIDAQLRLVRVQEENAKKAQGGTAAINQLKEAMDKLGPKAQSLARYIHKNLMPAFADIQRIAGEALAPGIEAGLRSMSELLPLVKDQMKDWGKAMGDAFAELGAHFATPQMKKDLKEISEGFLKLLTGEGKKKGLLDALIPITDIIVSITKAAQPMMALLTDKFVVGLDKISKWMKDPTNATTMEKFFTGGFEQLGKWLKVLEPLVGMFGSLMTAAKPLADWMLGEMATQFEKLDKLMSGPGKKGLEGFFTGMIPIIKQFFGVLSDLVGVIFDPKNKNAEGLTAFLTALRRDLIPALSELFGALAGNKHAASDFVMLLTKMINFVQVLGELMGLWDSPGKVQNDKNWGNYQKEHEGQHTNEPITGKPKGTTGIDGKPLFAPTLIIGGDGKLTIPVVADTTAAAKGIKALEDKKRKAVITAQAAVKDAQKSLKGTAEQRRLATIKAVAALAKAKADLAAFQKKNRSLQIGVGLLLKGDALTKHINTTFFGKAAPVARVGITAINPKTGRMFGEINPMTGVPWVDKKRQFGGPVREGQSYLVGEAGSEMFTPDDNGRIAPHVATSTGGGISAGQLDAILERVLAKAKPNNTFAQTFNEKVEPKVISSEIAWSLR